MPKRAKRTKHLLPPFGLDMPFDEAMERFMRTDPKEVEASIARSKQKKPPGTKQKKTAIKKPANDKKIVSLKEQRMRRHNGR